MELTARIVTVRLAETFTIARESQDVAEVVEVEVRHGDVSGFGEAAPIERYDQTAASALAWLETVELGDDPWALDEIAGALPPGEQAARAALDARAARPAGEARGRSRLQAARAPPRRAADLVDGLARRSRRHGPPRRGGRAARLPAAEAEARRPRRARPRARAAPCARATDLPLQVDVNEYWTLDEALELLPQMPLEYCEQPLPAGDPGGPELKRRSPVPIYVDEDCHTLADVAPCAERAHGVNLKLAKSGGIREAVRMANAARALGLGVMLGCMVESGLGIAAGAQIASLCDHVDLDGNLLLADDPWPGVEFTDGVQLPSDRPGLGVAPSVGSLILAEGYSADPHYGKTGARRACATGPRRSSRCSTRSGRGRRIEGFPIVGTVEEALALGPTTALVGVATTGGRFPPAWRELLQGLHRRRARHRERPARVHLRRPRARARSPRGTASSCATCASRPPASTRRPART